MKSGSINLIEIEAPWSFIKEQPVRVLVQDVDVSLETRAWDDGAAADFLQADATTRRLLDEHFADQRLKLLTSEEERAHWLSLFITALLNKTEVTIKNVRIRIDDAASKKGGAGAGSAPASFGLELDLLQLVAADGVSPDPPPLYVYAVLQYSHAITITPRHTP